MAGLGSPVWKGSPCDSEDNGDGRRPLSFLQQQRALYLCKARNRFEDILCADDRKVAARICSIAVRPHRE
jgi:hypothetical protein